MYIFSVEICIMNYLTLNLPQFSKFPFRWNLKWLKLNSISLLWKFYLSLNYNFLCLFRAAKMMIHQESYGLDGICHLNLSFLWIMKLKIVNRWLDAWSLYNCNRCLEMQWHCSICINFRHGSLNLSNDRWCIAYDIWLCIFSAWHKVDWSWLL